MSTMNQESFKRLQETLQYCSKAVGLKQEVIRVIGPGVITLGESGVSIFWSSDSAQGNPAWVVRETYQVRASGEDWRPVTQTVVIVPEQEYPRVAKLALLLIVERRLDSYLNRATTP